MIKISGTIKSISLFAGKRRAFGSQNLNSSAGNVNIWHRIQILGIEICSFKFKIYNFKILRKEISKATVYTETAHSTHVL